MLDAPRCGSRMRSGLEGKPVGLEPFTAFPVPMTVALACIWAQRPALRQGPKGP